MRKCHDYQVEDITLLCKELPFGFSLTPRVFTKLMKPHASQLSEQGVDLFMYFNDWLLMAESQASMSCMVDTAVSTSMERRFLDNLEKSHMTPSQAIKWVDVLWDTQNQILAFFYRQQLQDRERTVHSTGLKALPGGSGKV